MSFNGKVVLITGASSGIGADAAVHLSKLGAFVAIVGRDATKLNGVAEKITQSGIAEPLVIVADVTRDADIIIQTTIEKFGKLDVLINSAGIVEMGSIEEMSIDGYDRVMNTNVRGVLVLTQLAVPHLIKTKGNIINVSSVASSVPVTSTLAYCMSKAALDHFTKCIALDLARKGVRVNAINPAVIITPIFKTIGVTDEGYEALIKKTTETYPLKRPGDVSDTSKAIEFLASDNATFITGHLLHVDGGSLLSPLFD